MIDDYGQFNKISEDVFHDTSSCFLSQPAHKRQHNNHVLKYKIRRRIEKILVAIDVRKKNQSVKGKKPATFFHKSF